MPSYLAEKWQHVVQLVLLFFLGDFGGGVPELRKQFPQMHQS